MSADIWGVLRTVGLVVMMGCAFIADIILWWNQQYWWATFWAWIILSVVAWELASYAKDKKTISTRWKDWAKSNPIVSYITLGILATALAGLWLHLAVWGGMFG